MKAQVVTADPAGVDYREDSRNAPQNGYRSYDTSKIFLDPASWNNDRVSHERLSHYDMIKRANGGGPSDSSVVGHYVNDSERA